MTRAPKDLRQYLDIVSRIRVDHDGYVTILDELKQAYDDVGLTATPIFILLTGDSRTGKSSVVREVLDTHLPRKADDRTIQTVVYAVAPAKASVKALLESLLKGLGDPFWSRGNQTSMTERLYIQLDAVQCRLIILDEFQHLCDRGKADKLADWLKVLLETRKYGLIAVGLPNSASVVERHPQLVGRFDEVLRMPTFDWVDEASCAQFRAILKQFQTELHPFKLPNLATREMALRFYLATAGRIGLIAKLLDRAVRTAVRTHRLEIRIEDLARAYSRSIWGASRFPAVGGPFLAAMRDIEQQGVREAVLVQAAEEAVEDNSGAVEVHGTASLSPSTSRTATKPKPNRVASRNQRVQRERRELGGVL